MDLGDRLAVEMRKIYVLLLLLLTFIVESTLLRFIKIYGVEPDLLMVVVVSFALLDGKYSGIIYGLFAGFLQDVFFNPAVGMTMIPYMIVGYLSGYFNTKVFKEKTFTDFIYVVLSSLVFNAIMLFEMYLLNHSLDITTNIYKSLISIGYNSIASIILFKYFVSFSHKEFMKKRFINYTK